jgi:rhodanese-related sulfurtransferase
MGPGGQSAVVFLLTVSLGGGYQWCSKQGFLAQHAATAAITAAFNEEAADIVDLPRAQLMRIGGAQFIDARSASDFAAGHVDGSINIPPNATRLDRSTCLAGVVKDRPLVVYCQGPSCPNARVLAARLSRDGYRRISIFGGGWSAWDAAGASSFSDVPLLGSRP